MKLSNFIAVVVAILFATTTLHAATSGQGTAKITRIKGSARYTTGGNSWQTLREGDVLNPGATIQTASESTVDIVLGSNNEVVAPQPIVRKFTYGSAPDATQNIIRLRENTVLAIDRLWQEQTGADTVSETQLDLRAGRVFGNVKKLSAASKFEVKLPNGVAGIRGTLFDLTANSLTVFFGAVVISYFDGTGTLVTKVVIAGEQLDFNTGIIKPIPAGDQKDGKHQGDRLEGPGAPSPTYITLNPSRQVVLSKTENDQGDNNNNQ